MSVCWWLSGEHDLVDSFLTLYLNWRYMLPQNVTPPVIGWMFTTCDWMNVPGKYIFLSLNSSSGWSIGWLWLVGWWVMGQKSYTSMLLLEHLFKPCLLLFSCISCEKSEPQDSFLECRRKVGELFLLHITLLLYLF